MKITTTVLFILIVVSLLASPAFSRSFKSMDESRFIPDLSSQEELLVFEGYEEEREGRILIDQTADYSGTGPNNKHDPPSGSR